MTDAANTAWPKHPNGENKRVGEMSADERAAVMAASKARVMGSVPTTCIEHAYGTTERLSFQIKVF